MVGEELKRHSPYLFNQAIMELGETVCLPNGAPRCEECPLFAVCRARREGRAHELPIRKKPAPRKKEQRTVLVLHVGDRVALRRRPEAGLLSGLFEPFCLEGAHTEREVAQTLGEWGVTPLSITPLCASKHIFSHLEWHMTGYEIKLSEGDAARLPRELFFAPSSEIDTSYALPAAYRAYREFM